MKNEDSSEWKEVSVQMNTKAGDPLTYAVIGEAMRVHTELGPGLDEALYHNLLSSNFLVNGIAHKSKPRAQLLHRSLTADVFECDLLFENQLVVELKTLAGPETFAPDHFAQLICYLKFWRIGTGLLLDFGKERLLYRRVVFTDKPVLSVETATMIEPAVVSWKEEARPICDTISRVVQAHGLGYRDTTYYGLITADFKAETTPFVLEPETVIQHQEKLLGTARCHCIVVDGKIAVLVLALRDKISTTDRAILQTYLKLLGLRGGIIVNFGKRSLDMEFVNPPALNPIPTRT